MLGDCSPSTVASAVLVESSSYCELGPDEPRFAAMTIGDSPLDAALAAVPWFAGQLAEHAGPLGDGSPIGRACSSRPPDPGPLTPHRIGRLHPLRPADLRPHTVRRPPARRAQHDARSASPWAWRGRVAFAGGRVRVRVSLLGGMSVEQFALSPQVALVERHGSGVASESARTWPGPEGGPFGCRTSGASACRPQRGPTPGIRLGSGLRPACRSRRPLGPLPGMADGTPGTGASRGSPRPRTRAGRSAGNIGTPGASGSSPRAIRRSVRPWPLCPGSPSSLPNTPGCRAASRAAGRSRASWPPNLGFLSSDSIGNAHLLRPADPGPGPVGRPRAAAGWGGACARSPLGLARRVAFARGRVRARVGAPRRGVCRAVRRLAAGRAGRTARTGRRDRVREDLRRAEVRTFWL